MLCFVMNGAMRFNDEFLLLLVSCLCLDGGWRDGVEMAVDV